LKEMGTQLAERKFALMEQMGIEEEEVAPQRKKAATRPSARSSSAKSRQARAGSRSKSAKSSGRTARH